MPSLSIVASASGSPNEIPRRSIQIEAMQSSRDFVVVSSPTFPYCVNLLGILVVFVTRNILSQHMSSLMEIPGIIGEECMVHRTAFIFDAGQGSGVEVDTSHNYLQRIDSSLTQILICAMKCCG